MPLPKHHHWTIDLAIVFVLASFCSAADQSDALKLLQHAADISNIRTADVAPFRLHAQVKAFAAGAFDADYVLIWVAPDRWREEILVNNEHGVRIGGKTTVSAQNDTPTVHGMQFQLSALDIPSRLYVKPDDSLSKIKIRHKAGIQLQCVTRPGKYSNRTEFCFDGSTGVLLSDEDQRARTDFSQYAEFRGKLLPRLVRMFSDGKLHHEIQVQELIAYPNAAPDLFDPVPGSKLLTGCEHPVPPTPIKLYPPEFPTALRRPGLSQIVKLAATVNDKGRMEDVRMIVSAGPLDEYAIKAVEDWKYAPATCGGVPVPFQSYPEVHFNVQRADRCAPTIT